MASGPTCTNCGRVNRSGARMCAGCGKPLGTPTPPPPPPRPSTGAPPARAPGTPAQPQRGNRVRPLQLALSLGALILLCGCGVIVVGFVLGNQSLLPLTFNAATPTLVPVPTLAPPTSTLMPTITPLPPMPTSVPVPTLAPATATATLSPTSAASPTPVADTAAGVTLKPGETWVQNKMTLTLLNQKFAGVTCGGVFEFDFSLDNLEASEVVVSWRGEEITIKDDQDRTYEAYFQASARPLDCTKFAPLKGNLVSALGAKQSAKLIIQVHGPLDDKVTKLSVVVSKAGRVQNAKWEIAVPR